MTPSRRRTDQILPRIPGPTHEFRRAQSRVVTGNWVLKLLESANIKLSGVTSDVFGVSGLAMLEALAAGTTSASEMTSLARGRMRRKHAALEAALDGRMREHQRFLLAMQLRHLEAIGTPSLIVAPHVEGHFRSSVTVGNGPCWARAAGPPLPQQPHSSFTSLQFLTCKAVSRGTAGQGSQPSSSFSFMAGRPAIALTNTQTAC